MALPLIAVLGAGIIGRTIISIVGRVSLALGVGFFVMEGVQVGFQALIGLVAQRFSGLPADFAGLIGLSGFDVFASLVLSAYTASLFLQGIGGTIKRLRFK